MLESFQRNKELKAAKEAEELVTKGLAMLDGKMHKQAMITMQQAVKISPATVKDRMSTEFQAYNQSGDNESALSLGLLLIKITPKDFELANTLGNAARKLGNYKQANNLYRHALKVNKKFQIAFYNLAASMGKVDKFDSDATSALYQFKDIREYILPDYMFNHSVIEEITQELLEFNEAARTLELESMEMKIDELERDGEILEAKDLQIEMEKMQGKSFEPEPEQIMERLDELEQKAADSEKDKDEVPGWQFNKGLYSLQVRDGFKANEIFSKLKKQGHKLEYLEMCLALCREIKGETDEAIDEMIRLLGPHPFNRYLNVNLGLMYRKLGNRLLSVKYLLVGASLLEKSDGLYRLSDLRRIAEEHLEAGRYKKSLKLYEIIATEVDTAEPWMAMGEILLQMERLDEAADALKKALTIDPEEEMAEHKLRQIHDIYFDRADSFYRDRKYKPSAGLLEKAMRIMKTHETLRQAAAVYKLLKDHNRYDELIEEVEELKQIEKEKEQEELRQSYILKGRAFLSRKQFNQAVENFELAFRMKLDKDVFMFLATIYKKLNRQSEMSSLLSRWNKLVEHEERMQKFAKDKERAKHAED